MLNNLWERAEEALEDDRPQRAIEFLKRGVRKDPYWVKGQRRLAELYLVEVEHDAYALVQYRKLHQVAEDLEIRDELGLAWAYSRREFEDRAREVLQGLDDELPEQVEFLNQSHQTHQLMESIAGEVDKALETRQDHFYRKKLERGLDYLELGEWFHAQRALERALELKDTPQARLAYGRCLLKRKRYPQAVRCLKSLRSEPGVAEEAGSLLKEIYRRLGIKTDPLKQDFSSGRSSIAS